MFSYKILNALLRVIKLSIWKVPISKCITKKKPLKYHINRWILIRAGSLLGMIQQSLSRRIWGFSALLCFRSSPALSGGSGTDIFRSLQRFLIGFKSSLWLGHSKTFTELTLNHSWVACVLSVIVLLRSWVLGTISAAFSFHSTLTNSTITDSENHH